MEVSYDIYYLLSPQFNCLNTNFSWNEWVKMPLEFCDLPRTAQLAITIYDCGCPDKLIPVGGTTVSLFSKHGVFREVNLI